jgi:hypothetical protein
MGIDTWPVGIAAQHNRGLARLDAHGRLAYRIDAEPRHYLRAGRIAWEAARLVTLPTRDAPRTYVRKGVRYSVFAEDGVIWVVQEVPGETAREGAREAGKLPSAPPAAATTAPKETPAGEGGAGGGRL